MSAHATTTTASTSPVLSARMGLTARTALAGAMAGGVLAGGVLVAALTLEGRLSGLGLLHTSTGLFLVGSLLGFAGGALLGLAGRERGAPVSGAFPAILQAALFAVLGLSVAWVVSLWTALSVVAPHVGTPAAWTLVALGWIGSALILQSAVRPLGRALRNVGRRLGELAGRRSSGVALPAASA